MVSLYEFYLWAHLFAAVVWVGGGIAVQLFALRILRAKDPARLAGFAKDVEWIGMRVFTPASLLLVIFGFLLVEKADWGYPFWVVFGIVIWGLSALSGVAFLGPESARIGKLVEAHGVEHPEVHQRILRILVYSRIELLLLIAVVFDMVVKPFA